MTVDTPGDAYPMVASCGGTEPIGNPTRDQFQGGSAPDEFVGKAPDLFGPCMLVKFHAKMLDSDIIIAFVVNDVFNFEVVV